MASPQGSASPPDTDHDTSSADEEAEIRRPKFYAFCTPIVPPKTAGASAAIASAKPVDAASAKMSLSALKTAKSDAPAHQRLVIDPDQVQIAARHDVVVASVARSSRDPRLASPAAAAMFSSHQRLPATTILQHAVSIEPPQAPTTAVDAFGAGSSVSHKRMPATRLQHARSTQTTIAAVAALGASPPPGAEWAGLALLGEAACRPVFPPAQAPVRGGRIVKLQLHLGKPRELRPRAPPAQPLPPPPLPPGLPRSAIMPAAASRCGAGFDANVWQAACMLLVAKHEYADRVQRAQDEAEEADSSDSSKEEDDWHPPGQSKVSRQTATPATRRRTRPARSAASTPLEQPAPSVRPKPTRRPRAATTAPAPAAEPRPPPRGRAPTVTPSGPHQSTPAAAAPAHFTLENAIDCPSLFVPPTAPPAAPGDTLRDPIFSATRVVPNAFHHTLGVPPVMIDQNAVRPAPPLQQAPLFSYYQHPIPPAAPPPPRPSPSPTPPAAAENTFPANHLGRYARPHPGVCVSTEPGCSRDSRCTKEGGNSGMCKLVLTPAGHVLVREVLQFRGLHQTETGEQYLLVRWGGGTFADSWVKLTTLRADLDEPYFDRLCEEFLAVPSKRGREGPLEAAQP